MKRIYKLKRKYKIILNIIVGTIFLIIFLVDWYKVLFCSMSFTWLGLFTNIICLILTYINYNSVFNYLMEER